MNVVKVKYCGLKTTADIQNAIEAQVDAIGLVLVKKSPRFISLDDAKKLADMAKQGGLKVVALFADNSDDEVIKAIESFQPDVLQFHGTESVQFCEQFNTPYWKAIPMLATDDYVGYINKYPSAEAFLLDAFGGQQSGGSGQSFNWFEFPQNLKSRLILAGGINEDNVIEALKATGACYIDTSSGIETSLGIKSKKKMLALMNLIKAINKS